LAENDTASFVLHADNDVHPLLVPPYAM
jgi:hypothetical protein